MKPDLYNDVRISPDGSRVAVVQGTSGVADIWVYTFARGTYTRLTFTGINATPVVVGRRPRHLLQRARHERRHEARFSGPAPTAAASR